LAKHLSLKYIWHKECLFLLARDGKLGTSLVSRSTDSARLLTCYAEIKAMLLGFTPEVMEADLATEK